MAAPTTAKTAPKPANGNTNKAPARPAPAATTSTAPATEASTPATEAKRKYETVILGLSAARKPLFNRAKGLADSLGCRVSDLLWHGLEQVMQNPPKIAPAGASASSGTSPGFWVLHTHDDNGRLNGVRVVEVSARNQVDGGDRLFVRFKDDDAKSKERARANAIRSATYDLSIVGIRQEVTVEVFDPNA